MNQAHEKLPDPLLVGEHPALDFLNSIATPVDIPVDWLASGSRLLDWLEKSGTLPAEIAEQSRLAHSGRILDTVAAQARELREWLRSQVRKRLGQSAIRMTERDLQFLNDLLSESKTYQQVDPGPPPAITTIRPTADARQLLQPLAEAAADLFTNQDFSLIRACGGQGCTLIFLDKTKSHQRRWCSMALCGNRAKVAAFRDRNRGG